MVLYLTGLSMTKCVGLDSNDWQTKRRFQITYKFKFIIVTKVHNHRPEKNNWMRI